MISIVLPLLSGAPDAGVTLVIVGHAATTGDALHISLITAVCRKNKTDTPE